MTRKIIHFDNVTKKKMKKHTLNWPQIHDYPNRIVLIGASGSGKTNSLFNEICQQQNIDKIDFYAKNSFEVKYQFLINKQESTGLKL